jgi:hypothetical protein
MQIIDLSTTLAFWGIFYYEIDKLRKFTRIQRYHH